VLFANRAAREIVIARDGLAIVGGVLEAEQVSVRLKLRVLIGRAVRSAAGDSLKAAGAMRVSRPSMRRPYSVLVTPLRLAAAERTAPRVATILVSDPEREIEADTTAVQTAYGLSPAEARVAGAIAIDESVGRAAERLCLSVDTVRWHLKRIYRKTDTNRQAELVKLVLITSIR
jgi:DNA-binding CsgD family transcriptional regulator